MLMNHDVVDVEKLLNFVSCLSNEPVLILRKPQLLDSDEGRSLQMAGKEEIFAINIDQLTPDYYKLLKNQKKSTRITISEFGESAPFLERRLMSGELRRAFLPEGYKFPSAVLEQIVHFLEDPDDYSKNTMAIFAHFDDSTREMLDEIAEKKLCNTEKEEQISWTGAQIQYTFDKQKPIIRVQNSTNNHWCITCK